MKPLDKTGFTIVETMLFLGISGLLAVGVLVGTGSSINMQRYRDSVTSLQSFLQQQYSEVANVSNDVMENTCGGGIHRGQSDCVILGKYITTFAGNTFDVKNVLGTTCPTIASDDLAALQNCTITISAVNLKKYDLEWNSSAKKPSGDNLALSILVLRSPTSGIIRTFISSNNTTVISDPNAGNILVAASLAQSAKLCVDSNGLFTGAKMAVLINANATSANDIETLGDNSGCH